MTTRNGRTADDPTPVNRFASTPFDVPRFLESPAMKRARRFVQSGPNTMNGALGFGIVLGIGLMTFAGTIAYYSLK